MDPTPLVICRAGADDAVLPGSGIFVTSVHLRATLIHTGCNSIGTPLTLTVSLLWTGTGGWRRWNNLCSASLNTAAQGSSRGEPDLLWTWRHPAPSNIWSLTLSRSFYHSPFVLKTTWPVKHQPGDGGQLRNIPTPIYKVLLILSAAPVSTMTSFSDVSEGGRLSFFQSNTAETPLC